MPNEPLNAPLKTGDPEQTSLLSDAVPPVSVEAFRNAMATLGSAVHVVTTDGPAGRAGFTASAVCSVTDSPPTVLVCINRSASAYATTTQNGVVCINTLNAGQQDISTAFGTRMPMDQRFGHGEWVCGATGAPALEGAIMSIDCQIRQQISVGSHDILICEVMQIADRLHDGILIYYNRQYHQINKT